MGHCNSRDITCKSCTQFKLGMDCAKLHLIYHDIGANEFIDSTNSFLEYCHSNAFSSENSIRCITNSKKLCKKKELKDLGVSIDDKFICVWNYHIMFVRDENLTAKQWEYIVREVGEYPYPPDLIFQNIELPEDMP